MSGQNPPDEQNQSKDAQQTSDTNTQHDDTQARLLDDLNVHNVVCTGEFVVDGITYIPEFDNKVTDFQFYQLSNEDIKYFYVGDERSLFSDINTKLDDYIDKVKEILNQLNANNRLIDRKLGIIKSHYINLNNSSNSLGDLSRKLSSFMKALNKLFGNTGENKINKFTHQMKKNSCVGEDIKRSVEEIKRNVKNIDRKLEEYSRKKKLFDSSYTIFGQHDVLVRKEYNDYTEAFKREKLEFMEGWKLSGRFVGTQIKFLVSNIKENTKGWVAESEGDITWVTESEGDKTWVTESEGDKTWVTEFKSIQINPNQLKLGSVILLKLWNNVMADEFIVWAKIIETFSDFIYSNTTGGQNGNGQGPKMAMSLISGIGYFEIGVLIKSDRLQPIYDFVQKLRRGLCIKGMVSDLPVLMDTFTIPFIETRVAREMYQKLKNNINNNPQISEEEQIHDEEEQDQDEDEDSERDIRVYLTISCSVNVAQELKDITRDLRRNDDIYRSWDTFGYDDTILYMKNLNIRELVYLSVSLRTKKSIKSSYTVLLFNQQQYQGDPPPYLCMDSDEEILQIIRDSMDIRSLLDDEYDINKYAEYNLILQNRNHLKGHFLTQFHLAITSSIFSTNMNEIIDNVLISSFIKFVAYEQNTSDSSSNDEQREIVVPNQESVSLFHSGYEHIYLQRKSDLDLVDLNAHHFRSHSNQFGMNRLSLALEGFVQGAWMHCNIYSKSKTNIPLVPVVIGFLEVDNVVSDLNGVLLLPEKKKKDILELLPLVINQYSQYTIVGTVSGIKARIKSFYEVVTNFELKNSKYKYLGIADVQDGVYTRIINKLFGNENNNQYDPTTIRLVKLVLYYIDLIKNDINLNSLYKEKNSQTKEDIKLIVKNKVSTQRASEEQDHASDWEYYFLTNIKGHFNEIFNTKFTNIINKIHLALSDVIRFTQWVMIGDFLYPSKEINAGLIDYIKNEVSTIRIINPDSMPFFKFFDPRNEHFKHYIVYYILLIRYTIIYSSTDRKVGNICENYVHNHFEHIDNKLREEMARIAKGFDLLILLIADICSDTLNSIISRIRRSMDDDVLEDIINSSTLAFNPKFIQNDICVENYIKKLRQYYVILVHLLNKKRRLNHQENHKFILAISDILQTVKCVNERLIK